MNEPANETWSLFDVLCVVVTVMMSIQMIIVFYQLGIKYFDIWRAWIL